MGGAGVSWKSIVLSRHPDAEAKYYFVHDGCWYIWSDAAGLILGLGLAPVWAWRDAACQILVGR